MTSVYTRYAMAHSTYKLSHADLLDFPQDGKRHELIDGEHYVSASPTLRHQAVLRNLFVALHGFVKRRGLGQVFFAPVDVFLSDNDVVVPDLIFVRRKRLAILEDRFVRGAPDLAVEVISPWTRRTDLGDKRRAYRKFGFAEYWIVDSSPETVEVFRGEGDWQEPAARLSRAAGPQALASPLFPGLVLTLDQIFE
ncbi:MAG TPA: Uma2 family endonuclease [Thermoanaerobaculia bacterium]|nr:Uma2 family endonuclease [Thermoanaerobaculia bacterium]